MLGFSTKKLLPHFLALNALLAIMPNGHCGEGSSPLDTTLPLDLELAVSVDARDPAGLRRDTWYFFGYHVAAVGILYVMPESVTGWTDEQKSGYSMSVWRENATNPSFDTDKAYINYILHPYWGAAYYVRARERGYDSQGAFWYSVLLSTVFEFGVEALFEEPSIQDLIITPVVGSIVGHYFMGVRHNIRANSSARGHLTGGEKWGMVLTDPLGSLNRQVDKWIGREASLNVYPYFSVQTGYAQQGSDPVIGLSFILTW